MRKIIRSLEISLFEFIVLRITSGVSPSPCISMRKIIRSLAISPIGILILRIKEGASPSLCTSTRKFIRSLEISLFQNPHSAYKGKGYLRPHAPRQGKLYAALRFPPIGILILRIKGRGISVPMHLDRENYTQPCDFPSSEFSFCV